MTTTTNFVTVTVTCPFCGDVTEISVKADDLARYQCGALAQEAFPYLSATEREVVISGMCYDCQSKFFGSPDEGEEDEDEEDDPFACMVQSLGQNWW